ncbi:hypothetical protein LJC02_03445, partial [Breznakia sp. OttesenSCG-928-G09]|nr:hypothetical protein [Breznakia sp. OttesenSCG-928-G09]
MNIKIIKETKFKNVIVSVRFRSNLSENTIAGKMILSDLLSNVCAKYPDKQAVVNRLNELYGASLSSNYVTYGNTQVVELRSKFINSSFIQNDINLFDEVIKLLSDFIYRPLLDKDGMFNAMFVEEAKRITLSKIARIIDEPAQYSPVATSALIGKGQALGIQAIHQIDNIKKLTLKDLYAVYHNMIENDDIDILVVGD